MEHPSRGKRLLEVCVDNFQSALAAEAGGAGRIELCSSLLEGGLTPSLGFLKVVKASVRIPVFAMIRPRGGDFVYSNEEILIMEEDIKCMKAHGADGFVFGVLHRDGTIDSSNCSRLLSLAKPLPSTFHRAFDMTPHPEAALEEVISLGFARILTSGQRKTALEGLEVISSLTAQAEGRIVIMAGAGLTPQNVGSILSCGRVTEVHGSCRQKLLSTTTAPPHVQMGSMAQEMDIYVTDQASVESIVSQLI